MPRNARLMTVMIRRVAGNEAPPREKVPSNILTQLSRESKSKIAILSLLRETGIRAQCLVVKSFNDRKCDDAVSMWRSKRTHTRESPITGKLFKRPALSVSVPEQRVTFARYFRSWRDCACAFRKAQFSPCNVRHSNDFVFNLCQ